MKSYEEIFKKLKSRNEGALVAFIVIGDPDFETSLEITKNIVDAGADILELGIPFSDPIADGRTIQAADIRALSNGITTDKVFEFVKEVRKYTGIPIGLLSYYNLIYQRGAKEFYTDSGKAGVNGILIADMPIEEFGAVSAHAENSRIGTIFMVSPLTGNGRIKQIAKNATGFIYVVSRLGVTGAKSDLHESTLSLIRRVRQFTGKPLCIGFGISKPSHVRDVIKAGADGAIVGSAIVDLIEKNIGDKEKMLNDIHNYVKGMKDSTMPNAY